MMLNCKALAPCDSNVTNWRRGGLGRAGGALKYKTPTKVQQGKSEGIDSCDRPSNLTQIRLKW